MSWTGDDVLNGICLCTNTLCSESFEHMYFIVYFAHSFMLYINRHTQFNTLFLFLCALIRF